MEQKNEVNQVEKYLPGNYEIFTFIGIGIILMVISWSKDSYPNEYTGIGHLLLGLGFGESYVVRRIKKRLNK